MEVFNMERQNTNDLHQIEGNDENPINSLIIGVGNPFRRGYCNDCGKNVLVNVETGMCYECHGNNTTL